MAPESSQSGVSSGEAQEVNDGMKEIWRCGWHIGCNGDVMRFTKHGICMSGVFWGGLERGLYTDGMASTLL